MSVPYEEAGTLAISTYWCCLAAPERNVLIALSVYIVAMPPFISDLEYSILWAAQGAKSALERADAMVHTYHLEDGQYTPPEGEPIEGYYLTGDFWPVLFAWVAGGHAPCAARCKWLDFTEL